MNRAYTLRPTVAWDAGEEADIMTAMGYSEYDDPLSSEDRRQRNVDPSATPRRRIDDTLFNKIRWPAGIVLWFVGGGGLFVYLVYRLFWE